MYVVFFAAVKGLYRSVGLATELEQMVDHIGGEGAAAV